MSQADYNVANASGATVRADINTQLGAVATMNSGSSEPSTKFANMGWFDEANNLMKVRNEANAAWITIAEKTATEWKPYWNTALMDAAFQAIDETTVVIKTADETLNNDDVLQNDDHLLFAMAANITYQVRATLLLDAANVTPDFKFKWTVPASCSMLWEEPNDGAWVGSSQLLNDETDTSAGTNTIVGISGIQYLAIVRNGANAGNLQLQWAQNTAHASNSKLLKHSNLVIRKLGAT